MTKSSKEAGEFLSAKADVVIPLEREGGLSATEVLATHSWFRQRVNTLKSNRRAPNQPRLDDQAPDPNDIGVVGSAQEAGR